MPERSHPNIRDVNLLIIALPVEGDFPGIWRRIPYDKLSGLSLERKLCKNNGDVLGPEVF